jgi:hypothetical protein
MAAEPDRAARLGAILDEALARHPEPGAAPVPDEETRRGLRALGYAD